jgi:hypothetical protein
MMLMRTCLLVERLLQPRGCVRSGIESGDEDQVGEVAVLVTVRSWIHRCRVG